LPDQIATQIVLIFDGRGDGGVERHASSMNEVAQKADASSERVLPWRGRGRRPDGWEGAAKAGADRVPLYRRRARPASEIRGSRFGLRGRLRHHLPENLGRQGALARCDTSRLDVPVQS
jgi:hypothetical protein